MAINKLGHPETVWQDTLYALRTLRKKPAFAVTAVLTLALAIGGNTAMFTVIRTVLLKPLAYRDADRLVEIEGGATPLRFSEMAAAARSFTGLGAFTGEENVTLAGSGEPEVLKGVHVSANFLEILRADPLVGRSFRREEDSAGGAAVAMISNELWRRRFGSDPAIAGKTATLEAAAYTIIGVLPPRFAFPAPGLDVWMTAPTEWPLMPAKSRELSPFLTLFGRLKPGVTLAAANAEFKVIQNQYLRAHPSMLDAKPRRPVGVRPMKDQLVDGVRTMLWMLFGAVGFVLAIACANVASLLLARATSRSREFAVRAALGAGRRRLMGQLLTESLLLGLVGGAFGLALAAGSLRAIPHITAFELPRAGEIHLDWMVLGFAVALSTATGVLFGLLPSLHASRPDLMGVLRTSGAAAQQDMTKKLSGGLNVRGLLSVGQVALSIVLLIAAALLMESVAHLRGVDLGFRPAGLLTMQVSLPPLRYETEQKKKRFFEDVVKRIESLPGVRSATAAMSLPMTAYAGSPVQDASKPPLLLNERPIAKFLPVTPGYFRTLEIPMRRGREFTEHDSDDRQRVAIIDETLAKRFWSAYPSGGVNPIGQHLLIGGINPKPVEIVGIVANSRQSLEDAAWPDSVYVAFAQNPQPFAMLAIRTAGGDPLAFAKAVRGQVDAVDSYQPVADVKTMDDLVEEEVGQRRLLVMLLGSFASVALLLALIGIYGVVAYSVAQRVQEVGIRRALGAQQADILRMVIREGLALALAGIVFGLGGAFALTRVMKTMLYGVSSTDPLTFAVVAALFLTVALAACYIPARRAARLDPMAALRV